MRWRGSSPIPYLVHVLSKLGYIGIGRRFTVMSFTTRSQEASTLGSDFAFEACVVAAEQLTSMLGTEGVGSGWTVTSADRSPFRPIHAAAK